MGIFLHSACVHCIFTCRQNDSLLDEKSSEWQHMDLSQAYTAATCNIWTFGFLGLKEAYFF